MQIILISENIGAEFVADRDGGIVVKYPIKIDDKMVDKFEFRPPGSYRKPEDKPEESGNDVKPPNIATNEGKKRGNPNWKKKEDK